MAAAAATSATSARECALHGGGGARTAGIAGGSGSRTARAAAGRAGRGAQPRGAGRSSRRQRSRHHAAEIWPAVRGARPFRSSIALIPLHGEDDNMKVDVGYLGRGSTVFDRRLVLNFVRTKQWNDAFELGASGLVLALGGGRAIADFHF